LKCPRRGGSGGGRGFLFYGLQTENKEAKRRQKEKPSPLQRHIEAGVASPRMSEAAQRRRRGASLYMCGKRHEPIRAGLVRGVRAQDVAFLPLSPTLII
jgi:hypothetical protein